MQRRNKYYSILEKIISEGKTQMNRKGSIRYLLNEHLTLCPSDLLDIDRQVCSKRACKKRNS